MNRTQIGGRRSGRLLRAAARPPMARRGPLRVLAGLAVLTVLACAMPARAEQKLIVLDDTPALRQLKVSADGSRLYFAADKFAIFEAGGTIVDRFNVPNGLAPRNIVPLPDGWFVACISGLNGHIALLRPDGTPAKRLVGKGSNEKVLRHDMTGWTSPVLATVDPVKKLIFVVDTSMAPRDVPDPVWSRIAVFDFEGRYVNDINRYDGRAADAKEKDGRRLWYGDLEVDPARQRVYVTARGPKEVLVFGYDGTEVAKIAPPAKVDKFGGALAVFPDGRLAAAAGRDIIILSADYQPVAKITGKECPALGDGVGDLATDGAGRLYAVPQGRRTSFVRWEADLKTYKAFGPRYVELKVEFPATIVLAGKPVGLKAALEGRPAPAPGATDWQAMLRPADGSDLRWQSLAATYDAAKGTLNVAVPEGIQGLYDLAVRIGEGPIRWTERAKDVYVQKAIAVSAGAAAQSVSVIPATGRRVYRQGEAIPLHVVRRTAEPAGAAISVKIALEHEGAGLSSGEVQVSANAAVEVPGALSARLAPGRYLLRPSAEGHASYPLPIDIASPLPDSPVQRIVYHEMHNSASGQQQHLADTAERLAFIRDWTEAEARLGFVRDTDRLLQHLGDKHRAWRRDAAPAPLKAPGLAPPEYYAIPAAGDRWEPEYFLDQAARYGIRYDVQILDHCAGVRFRDYWLRKLVPVLDRGGQWLSRFPAFYGFNYHDEMFFGGWASGWTKDDVEWLKSAQAEKCGGDALAAKFFALRTMYARFNEAARRSAPGSSRTLTPMWQYPAVEGNYAPIQYEDMTETYSHFVSEGYHLPWYAAHSAAFLKRPGKPLMAVFDQGTNWASGAGYAKNVMQTLARGAQGTGVSYLSPFEAGPAADPIRAANTLAKVYGPVFAEFPPANEAAVLYSYAQDVTEKRNNYGTPQWERVFALYGAGLMAGVPMEILYEEDVAAGLLLAEGKPRVPMLFLVGLNRPLPPKVEEAVAGFVTAGGKVFTDEESADRKDATKLPIRTHELKKEYHSGYASDTTWPLFFPKMEDLARALHKHVARHRRYPIGSDELWVSKNRFDGGAIQYVMLASETGAFPWEAGKHWSLNTVYNNTYVPTRVRVTLPKAALPEGAVAMELFDREQVLVHPAEDGGRAAFSADLTTFPGRLFAIAPEALAEPRVTATVVGGRVAVRVRVLGASGRPMAARVPLRLRLSSGRTEAFDIYRGTGPDGTLDLAGLPLPGHDGPWTLDVTQLITHGETSVELPSQPEPLGPLLANLPPAEVEREAQIRALLKWAGPELALVTPREGVVREADRKRLAEALARHGLTLKTSGPTKEPARGVYLVAGTVENNAGDEMLSRAITQGQFGRAVSQNVPGPGRGIVSAIFSPRADHEHCIALLGGDAAGLGAAVDALARLLEGKQAPADTAAEARPAVQTAEARELSGRAIGAQEPAYLPRVSDMVGARLSALAASADGKHLAITADGYLNNLALVDTSGNVPHVARVGRAHTLTSPFVSDDGRLFGAAAKDTARFNEAFHLVDVGTNPKAPPTRDVFTAFGDMGRAHSFAASADGNTVLAPGNCGLVCWRREAPGGAWKEAWAIDYWKRFDKLDWPVSGDLERLPQFHAYIPRGADFALVTFSETTNNGWVTPENAAAAALFAVRLSDGKELWRFDVPLPKQLLLPTPHLSPDGRTVLLQVQVGSWGRETFQFYALRDGKVVGSWASAAQPGTKAAAPRDVSVANDGTIALALTHRLIEVRKPDGALARNLFWKYQPASVALAKGGKLLVVSDDQGDVTCLDLSADAGQVWKRFLGTVAKLGAVGDRIYALGGAGALWSMDPSGRSSWSINLTSDLAGRGDNWVLPAAALPEYNPARVHRPDRAPTSSARVPDGENLLRTGKARLTVGGTKGWMSQGTVQVKPEELTNGKTDDMATPWLALNEVFWGAYAGRQVWAEITFPAPTDVKALTVRENPAFPDSFPTESLLQVWDDKQQRWDTAARGVFLAGPVNTYELNLKGVTRLRYLPWSSYYRNFYTSEIEVR